MGGVASIREVQSLSVSQVSVKIKKVQVVRG